MKKLIKALASFGYLGFVPFVPGTAGSLGALGLYFLSRGDLLTQSLLLFGVTLVGFIVSGPAEDIFGRKDPPQIVIDEVAGMLLALWAVPADNILIVSGFCIFRALDAAKVFPVNKMEKLPGALGVMGDDLLAGLYTNVALQLAARVLLPIS